MPDENTAGANKGNLSYYGPFVITATYTYCAPIESVVSVAPVPILLKFCADNEIPARERYLDGWRLRRRAEIDP